MQASSWINWQYQINYKNWVDKGKNEQDALYKAAIAWEGNNFNKKGEKNDPYNLLCYKNMDLSNPLFKEQAKKVFLPALSHQEKYS